MSNEKETKVSALDAKAKALANEEDEDTKIAKLLKNMPKWQFLFAGSSYRYLDGVPALHQAGQAP